MSLLAAELKKLCDDAGVEEEAQEFLSVKMIRHTSTLANLAIDEESYVDVLVKPLSDGITIGARTFKAKSSAAVTRATILALVEDAKRVRKNTTISATLSTPPSATHLATAAPATTTSDTDKAPKTLPKNAWQNKIKRWEESYTPNRVFPARVLLGAESVLARMIWEHENKCYTLLQLGEIMQFRSFTAMDEINKLATRDFDKALEIRAYNSIGTKRQKVFEPNSILTICDSLDAAKWAFVFCEYAKEEEAGAYTNFFVLLARRHTNELDKIRDLWNSAYWRISEDMRMSHSFAEATKSIMTDNSWIRDQLSKNIKRQRQDEDLPNGKRHKGSKGKGKGNKNHQHKSGGRDDHQQQWNTWHNYNDWSQQTKPQKGKGKGKGKHQKKQAAW